MARRRSAPAPRRPAPARQPTQPAVAQPNAVQQQPIVMQKQPGMLANIASTAAGKSNFKSESECLRVVKTMMVF